MSFWGKLSNLDRRIIFFALFLAVILPLIFPLGLPIKKAQPPVEALYQYIEKLPRDSVVLMVISYDPSSMPELYPMTLAVVRHCFKKNLRVLGVSTYLTGIGLGEMAIKTAAEEYDKKEGTDYVYLGFKPGPVYFGMGEDIHTTFPADYNGVKMDNLPMMQNVISYAQIALIVDYTASNSYYIGSAVTKYNANLAIGVTAVGAADYYPYLQTKQIVALLGGLRSAAEYELLIGKPDKGFIRMDSQSIAHLLIIALIVIGNIAYFAMRKKKVA